MLYAILRPIIMLLARLFFGLRSRGMEHVPGTGPVLFVANHASFLDSPLVGSVAPRPLNFMAKAELFQVPLFGGLIRRLNAHPLRREGGDAGALRAALRVLKSGGGTVGVSRGHPGRGRHSRHTQARSGYAGDPGRRPGDPGLHQRQWPRLAPWKKVPTAGQCNGNIWTPAVRDGGGECEQEGRLWGGGPSDDGGDRWPL